MSRDSQLSIMRKPPADLPDTLDVLVVGGGPGGTAAAFRTKELGLSVLVIDYDDILKRIRDYAKDKLILPDFGGGDKMKFPMGGELVKKLHFQPIDKDEMHVTWRDFYASSEVPVQVGVELTGIERRDDGVWRATAWSHSERVERLLLARHVVLSIGRGVPRRFDIPGNADGIGFRLDRAEAYVGAPALVIGGGTSAGEAVIAISNAKIEAGDQTAVYWSYRGEKMPRVSKALAEVFFEAYIGNGNIRYYPKSDPANIVTGPDREEYLSLRVDRKSMDGRPCETTHLEFPKTGCIACIGEDIPESFLNSMGIHMATGGPNNKKRMLVNSLLETIQPNVYMVGDMLSQAYFETEDFNADPSRLREVKHRGNIKSALRDGVFVAEVVAQRCAGKKDVKVELEYADAAEASEAAEARPRHPVPMSIILDAESQGPPRESTEKDRGVTDAVAILVRLLPGDIEENEFSLREGQTTTIGSKGCDLTFADDTALSESHASVAHGPDGYFLRDDGSATGVFLRARPATPVDLETGDIVRAGRQFLVVGDANGKGLLRHYNHKGTEVGAYDVVDRTSVMGRDAPDITLDASDMTLSRRHLACSFKHGNVQIKDLKSANGTYCKVRAAVKLTDGDEFRLGRQNLRFSMPKAEHESVEASPAPVAVPEPSRPVASVSASASDKREARTPEPAAAGGEPSVTFEGTDKTLPIRPGQSICEAAEEHGIEITAECHAGVCGSDPIRIVSGGEFLNDLDDGESTTLEDICELEPGKCRMACMARPTGPVVVGIVKQD